ncbi:MAG: dehydrogenase [Methanotrichaceae archaeon]|nr:dehydrogenase [Methanotrichaceae archaeon]
MVKYKIKVIILTLAFLALLFTAFSITHWGVPEEKRYIYESWEGARYPESGIGEIAMEIFTIYVFSFEVLALVLTAALVGAIYIAKKEAV